MRITMDETATYIELQQSENKCGCCKKSFEDQELAYFCNINHKVYCRRCQLKGDYNLVYSCLKMCWKDEIDGTFTDDKGGSHSHPRGFIKLLIQGVEDI